ncbi:MAG: hypothetical protein EAX86_12405 [Candidatus Heimdallarchaeota archaeon]|nr:hypothetical protein [Candidatus Heimdallarchaeota archaeon]
MKLRFYSKLLFDKDLLYICECTFIPQLFCIKTFLLFISEDLYTFIPNFIRLFKIPRKRDKE